MRARDFLLEYDATATARNFAETLFARAFGYKPDELMSYTDLEQGSSSWDVNWEDARGTALLGLNSRRHFEGGEKIIDWFEKNDPSRGKFVLTMIRWYMSNDMHSLEDAPKLKGPIATYVKFRNRIKGIDLRKITFDEFIDAMEAQQGKLSSADSDKAEEQGYYDRKDAVLVHNDSTMKIVLLKTMAASCFFGRNTRWCTTSRDKNENMFNSYAKDGPMFVILDKANNERWQFHFDLSTENMFYPEHQFMDEKDHPVEPEAVMGGDAMFSIYGWASDEKQDSLRRAIIQIQNQKEQDDAFEYYQDDADDEASWNR